MLGETFMHSARNCELDQSMFVHASAACARTHLQCDAVLKFWMLLGVLETRAIALYQQNTSEQYDLTKKHYDLAKR